MRFSTSIRMLVVMAVIVVLLPGVLLAQSEMQGAISGTVKDSKGAVVPNITVKLNSLDRGVTRETKTDTQGAFMFPLLDLGSYQVEVNVPEVGSYLGSVAVTGGNITEVVAKLGGAMTAEGGGARKTTQFLIGGTLAAALDCRKTKPGEEVVIKTIGDERLSDGTVIPHGTKVIGHVTEAKARAGGDAESLLGIAFDKVELKDGKTLAIAGVIRAVGPAPEPKSGGGVDYGFFGMIQAIEHTQASTQWGATPGLNGDSAGVVGIKGLELSSDGVLKSSEKTIKLDYEAQIILRAHFAGGN
jgi:hypothetical protein